MIKGYISHRPAAGVEEGPEIHIYHFCPQIFHISSHLFSEWWGKTPASDPASEKQVHPDIQQRIRITNWVQADISIHLFRGKKGVRHIGKAKSA